MPWTTLPAVAALLASCANDPPAQRYARGHLGPNDGEMIYAGERVKRLEGIWRKEADRLWDAERDLSVFAAHCRLSVQSAIRAAIEAGFHNEMEDAA